MSSSLDTVSVHSPRQPTRADARPPDYTFPESHAPARSARQILAIQSEPTPRLTLRHDERISSIDSGWHAHLWLPTIVRRAEVPVAKDCALTGGTDEPTAGKPGESHLIKRFQPSRLGVIQGAEAWTDASTRLVHWRTMSRDGIETIYGHHPHHRILDPAQPTRVLCWLPDHCRDRHGNVISFQFQPDGVRHARPSVTATGRHTTIRLQLAPGHDPTSGGDTASTCAPTTATFALREVACQVLAYTCGSPATGGPMTPMLSLDAVALCFRVSRDEEHIELEIVAGMRRIALPVSTIWFTLLTLARERLADQERGVADAEAGWLDTCELQRMLKVSPDVLNHHVLRSRKAFAAAGVQGYQGIIDRSRVGKIRVGIDRLVIVPSGSSR